MDYYHLIWLLQTSLDSALDEKKSFSKAVESLKANTARVEQNFKQMKQELTARNIKVTCSPEVSLSRYVTHIYLIVLLSAQAQPSSENQC